eukprot:547050_1
MSSPGDPDLSAHEDIELANDNNQPLENKNFQINATQELSNYEQMVAVFASSIGNLLEWFDFAMFGLLANEIGHNFFPEEHNNIQVLDAFAVFAGAFFMRPVGGILFGYIGDKHGRILSLRISIFMMAIPTFLTGCLPTYETIGIIAPILLTIFRLIQGVSVGGELTGAVTYVLEVSPPGRKAFLNALVFVSGSGTLLGVLFVGILRAIFTKEQMNSYAWRIPFLFGVVVAITGCWMRNVLPLSNEFMLKKSSGQTLQNPVKEIFKNHKLTVITVILHLMFQAAFYYAIWIWLPEYLQNKDTNPLKHIYLISGICMATHLCVMLLSGWIIDKYFNSDPTFILIIFGIITVIYTLIVFPFLDTSTSVQIFFIEMFWGIFSGMYNGGWSLWAINRFKNATVVRYSGFGISYNVALALFGGTTPLIATALMLRYDIWTLGVLLFVYGCISVGVNIICHFYVDKTYQSIDALSESESETEALAIAKAE